MKKISLLAASAIFISACGGGGGGGGSSVDPNAPVANAGADRSVAERSGTVSLSGSATDADGTVESYEWEQTGGSPTVSITLSTSQNATFEAPAVSGTQVLTFTLTAVDNDLKQDSDSVRITITDNQPTADAGDDQSVESGETVTLSGSASGGDAAYSYLWTQTSGQTVSLAPSSSAQSPTFVAPEVTEALVFSLTVSDSDDDTDVASVTINVVQPAPPVADAGDNQSANERALVTLNGSASSDADGTIDTYLWQQTSGTTVVLSDSAAVSPTFTAPDVDGAANEVLSFQLTVTDNDGSSDTDTVNVTITNTHVDVSGTIRFERVPFSASGSGLDYDSRSYLPARAITIAVGSNCGSSVKTSTDNSGQFSVRLPVNTSGSVNACAELVADGDASWQVSVVDNTNSSALYGVRYNLTTGLSDKNEGNIDLPSGWSDSNNAYSSARLSGPFAILDSVYDAIQKTVAENATTNFPALTINWSVNNTSAPGCTRNLSTGCIGTSFYTNSNLYILGRADVDTDEFDTHVVIHEWGHYFEDQLSRSDSIGGSHSGSDRLDMRVSFGEGFGNALSGIVTDDPVYRDTAGPDQAGGFSNNVESNSAAGWHSEISVQGILYDLYDVTADGDDNLALGWAPLLETFTDSDYTGHSAFTSIYTFLEQLKVTSPASSAAIDTLAANRGVIGTGAYASGETNDGGLPANTVLPVYTNIPLNTATTLCSTDNAGTYNKLGNRRYGRLQTGNAGSYSLTTSSTGTDTDVLIYLAGSVIARSEAAGEENSTFSLLGNTDYVIEIYDFANVRPENPGDFCSTLTITAGT